MAKRILIIEDDPTAIRLTEYTLKQRGFTVYTSCNGLEGLITAQKEEPDLIILDIMLPGIDGYELCKRLRAGSQTARIPILILSAKTQQEDIAMGLRAGANDYLAKPASPAEIISRVENLLSVSAVNRPRRISFVSSDKNLGMTMILASLAVSIAERDKQVVLIDTTSGTENENEQHKSNSEEGDSIIIETVSSHSDSPEPMYEVLPSGIRVLHIDTDNARDEEKIKSQIELLQKISLVNDYLLIDVPFNTSPLTRSIISKSHLCILVSDYRINHVSEIVGMATSLRFLDVTSDKLAIVLVDPQGKHASNTLLSSKPYIEANLGINLAGVVSYDAGMYRLSYLDNQSIIQSSPTSQLARDINTIVQYILTCKQSCYESQPTRIETPSLEKKR
jgi:DNA-binding response OmpR family regulator